MRSIITKVIFLSFLLVAIMNVHAQGNLSQVFKQLKDKIIDIDVDKTAYKQSLEVIDEAKGKIKFSSTEITEKGKSTKSSYEFFVSDIDINIVNRKPMGKKLLVTLGVNNKQKFIKQFKDDKIDNYTNEVGILVNNADAGQLLVDDFKAAIVSAKAVQINWNNSKDVLNWLKQNITKVTTNSGLYDQSFSFDDQKNYLIKFAVLKTDMKGVNSQEYYEFNMLDINKNQLQLKVNGSVITVKLAIKGDESYIKYVKKDEQQSYQSDFEILAEDVSQARELILAFTAAINLSKKINPEFSNINKAIDCINTNIGEVKLENKTIKQKFEATIGQGTKSTLNVVTTDAKGKATDENFIAYLNTIEANTINFKVSGKKVILTLKTKNNDKLVKCTKDNLLQNFDNEIEIQNSNIETARILVDAFKSAIQYSEIPAASWSSTDDAIDFLKKNIKGEIIDKTNYNLSFEVNSKEPYNCKYIKNKVDEKGVATEYVYHFYPYMLEANTAKVKSSGKYLSIYTTITNKKPFIKSIKNAKEVSFTEELEIMSFDSKNAKDIMEAIKYIALNSKPKTKNWADKPSVMTFITNNLVNFKSESVEFKQKIEFVNDNPNNTIYTKTTTDDKGKSSNEVFEFSMADMNKMAVNYEIRSKNIVVKLVCKNNTKLVKIYKDGQQKSFDSEVEILADDMNSAKILADAITNLIIQCEK